jgi:hypothetical protein
MAPNLEGAPDQVFVRCDHLRLQSGLAGGLGDPLQRPPIAAAGGEARSRYRAGCPTLISFPSGSNIVNARMPKFVCASGVNRAESSAPAFHSS